MAVEGMVSNVSIVSWNGAAGGTQTPTHDQKQACQPARGQQSFFSSISRLPTNPFRAQASGRKLLRCGKPWLSCPGSRHAVAGDWHDLSHTSAVRDDLKKH